MKYYSIPLCVDKIIKGDKQNESVDVLKSIHQNIYLILKTFTLSYRYDPSYGSILNKFHASTPTHKKLERQWREEMRVSIQKNLKDMMQRYETRVRVSDLTVDLQTMDKKENDSLVFVKVQIFGDLTLGNKQNFHYPDSEIAEGAQEVFPLMIPVK